MVVINRKPSVTLTSKVQAEVMAGLYTVDLNNLSRITELLKTRCFDKGKESERFIEQELAWLDKFENSLYLGVRNNNVVSASLSIDVDTTNPITSLDSDQCSIDVFGTTFLNSSVSDTVKSGCYKSALTGVINNFRLYTRSGCDTIVFDYRHLMDCITLLYCFRDIGVSIDQIESILDDCKPGIVNPCGNLDVLIKFCLGLNRSTENTLLNLVTYKNQTVKVRDGEFNLAMSQLRMSTDCFQYIKGSNQVETWQHHRIDFQPKMLYRKVLDYSAKEILTTLVYTIANDIVKDANYAGIKIMCADNNCIALSVPSTVSDISQLHQLGDVVLRLFNRSFEVPCRIYKYNVNLDTLEEQ